MITVSLLLEAGINPTAAKLHAAPMQAACERFDITSPARQAAFLGQAAHETEGLTAFEENLRYSRPERIRAVFRDHVHSIAEAMDLVRQPQRLANVVYAGRYGNGDEASGDGWRYRGRGAGHLTFRDNYAGAERALGRPYLAQPELLAEPADAALSFAWYWHTRKCNFLADAWHVDGITKAINPAMAGADRRWQWCEAFAAAMRA